MTSRRIKVRLVLDAGNKPWIIGKIADRLAEHLSPFNVDVEISDEPSSLVDVNHWMFYAHAWTHFFQQRLQRNGKSTAMITHIDDSLKLKILREVMNENVDIGICMSQMTQCTLELHGIPKSQLRFVLPAHDGRVKARRIKIGITTRTYEDGRKREDLLIQVAAAIHLTTFHFEIFGSGWEKTIQHLLSAGATVNYHPGSDDSQADYVEMINEIPNFDYYLYMGLDEGSMGFLDAVSAGCLTIVTNQGFHLDVPNGITHGFVTFEELLAIFQKIISDRQLRINAANELSWSRYAESHARIWHGMVGTGPERPLIDDCARSDQTYRIPNKSRLALKFFSVITGRKISPSVFHELFYKRQRWKVRRSLSSVKQFLLRKVFGISSRH